MSTLGPSSKTRNSFCGAEELPDAAREEGGAGEIGHELGGGAAVGGVARDVPGEGRGDERGPLVGPPVLGEDPADAGLVGVGVADVERAPPGVDGDLADREAAEVGVAASGGLGLGGDDLDVARVEADAARVVARAGWGSELCPRSAMARIAEMGRT
jgi:hypothetical protein